MIHIKRSSTPACLLEDDNSDGSLETERAIDHYRRGKAGEYPFEVYKRAKDELKKMFHGKCAYCDSKIDHVQFMHVEHYRPKGYVAGEPKGSPGYYWLASKWENLLLACEYCNGQGHKGNHFPLKDPGKRIRHPKGNVSLEEPLLINPCEEEHPEDHLIFEEDGMIKGVSLEGHYSVKHYGLYREELRRVRAEHIKELNVHITSLMSSIESYNMSKSQVAENSIRVIIEHFKSKKGDCAQFAGLSRQYLDEKVYDVLWSITSV